MSTPRYVTLDPFARIIEVTDLFDRFGNHTEDPAIAASCVLRWSPNIAQAMSADDVPIYTVH